MRTIFAFLLLLAAAGTVRADEPVKSPMDEALKVALSERRVTLDLKSTAFDQVIDSISKSASVAIVVDPLVELEKPIDFKLETGTLLEALNAVVAQVGAEHEVYAGMIFIALKSEAPPIPPAMELTDAARTALADKKVTWTFKSEPLDKVAAEVSKALGVPVDVEPAGEFPHVFLTVRDLRLESACLVICRMTGYRIVKNGDGLRFAL